MSEKFFDCCKSVWSGSVCLEIAIAESDISSTDNPESVFVLAPRHSYLPVTLADVVVHFRQHAIEFSSEVWFESKGIPLRSTFPTGLLFDQHNTGSSPWKIVVHFQAFPSSLLLKCSGPIESEHFYFHSLKQALFLIHGTTRLFNEMAVEQQRKLWNSVQSGDMAGFESVGGSLRPPALLEGSNANFLPTRTVLSAISEVKAIPVRLIQIKSPVMQRPVAVWKGGESGEGLSLRTLGEVLLEDFSGAYPPPDAGDKGPVQCIVQGVEVPLDAPMYDLWRMMSHCDLFLYISLRITE